MSRTVLLVNPPIYDFSAYDFFNKPLGLLYLGGFLREYGYEVRLVDATDRNHPVLRQPTPDNRCLKLPNTRPDGTGKYYSEIIERPGCLSDVPRRYRRYGLPEERMAWAFQNEAEESPPLAVLVTSMMTYWYPATAEAVEQIRRMMPRIPIGLGGVYATLMPEHALRVCRPDRLFTGGAFRPVLQWLDGLSGQHRDYGGVNEGFFAWPLPAYDLYDRLDYLTLITSLGCPFHCDYCASRILQPRLLQLPPERFLGQLERLLDLLKPCGGRLNVAFMDDALLAGAENHILSILKQTAKLQLPLSFHCPNGLHCRFITAEVAEWMAANHFRMVRLSFESADAAGRWQKASDNKIHNEDLIRAVQSLEKAGFRRPDLETYILTGLPGQTMQEIRESVDFVHNLGVQVRLCHYTPIAGTRLFEASCRHFGVDPNEPLLHNNTILPALDRRFDWSDWQELKNDIEQLNRSL